MEYIEDSSDDSSEDSGEEEREEWEKRMHEEKILDARFLELFLSGGSDMFDINIQDRSGQTPLIIACKYGLEEVVRGLLRHSNLDVNMADNNGDTALMVACGRSPSNDGNEAIVSMLLGHQDIQVNKVTSCMDTPLAWSRSYLPGMI